MDPRAPGSDREHSRATLLDTAIRIGLTAALIYACSRIILPLHEVLIWSAILDVMLYPMHARLLGRIGDRWSALLIGLVGGTIVTIPTIAVVTSAGSSIYAFLLDVQNQAMALPPVPNWLARVPLVGQKLAEAWALAAASSHQNQERRRQRQRRDRSERLGCLVNLSSVDHFICCLICSICSGLGCWPL